MIWITTFCCYVELHRVFGMPLSFYAYRMKNGGANSRGDIRDEGQGVTSSEWIMSNRQKAKAETSNAQIVTVASGQLRKTRFAVILNLTGVQSTLPSPPPHGRL